jgi:stage II sporulation protein D
MNKFIYFLALIFISFFPLIAYASDIKIGLVTSNKQIRVGSDVKADLIDLSKKNNQATQKTISIVNKRETLYVVNKNGRISVFNKTKNLNLGIFTGPILLKPNIKNGLVFCQDRWYRGDLLIFTNADVNNLTIVNVVDLENYLLSVLPSEMPYKWNHESLKAQAVAARSYTLGYLGRRKEKGYDLESTVEDQVYTGVLAEKWSTTRAVKDTKGVILLNSEDTPLIALYHSSGGGYTDSIENLWDETPSPHIQPRPDYDDKSPHFKWTRTFKISDLSNALSSLNLGEIKNIIPLSVSVSRRVTMLEIVGSKGKTQIRGEQLRRILKLPSSKFNLEISKGIVNFAGRGYGHGLGLSQWGSKSLADNGFNFRQILAHYYTGAKLVKVED